ncbi:YidB family protein [Paracoccaceae bacterium]
MSRSTPSLLALLGLVAVAGYQNRDRISDMLSDARQKVAASGTDPAPAGGGFVAEIGQFFQGNSVSTALGDLIQRFKASGQGDAAESWVSEEANMPLGVDSLESALGPETLAELARKTGLSQAEVLLRLNVALPDVVSRLTPDGRLPTEGEVQARV